MKTNKLFWLTLLLSGVMVLAACAPEPAPETAPEEPQEPSKPEPTEPVAYPYPYPEPEPVVRPINPDAYPAPGDVVSDEPLGYNPYPDVDDEGNEKVLTPIDFSVLAADKGLQSGPAYIDSTDVFMKESYPVQVELVIVGSLPTPCHQLRVITSEPDAEGHIQIQAYSVSDPETIKGNLIDQLTAPVKWTQTAQNMIKDGASLFTEIGPGKVLQGLIKKVDRQAQTAGVSAFEA